MNNNNFQIMCPRCHNGNSAGSSFCAYCGISLAVSNNINVKVKKPASIANEIWSRILFSLMMYSSFSPIYPMGYLVLGKSEYFDILFYMLLFIGIAMIIAYFVHYFTVIKGHMRVRVPRKLSILLICIHAIALLISIGMITYTVMLISQNSESWFKDPITSIFGAIATMFVLSIGGVSGISLLVPALICFITDTVKLTRDEIRKR